MRARELSWVSRDERDRLRDSFPPVDSDHLSRVVCTKKMLQAWRQDGRRIIGSLGRLHPSWACERDEARYLTQLIPGGGSAEGLESDRLTVRRDVWTTRRADKAVFLFPQDLLAGMLLSTAVRSMGGADTPWKVALGVPWEVEVRGATGGEQTFPH